MAKTFPTKNSLPEKTRAGVAALLNVNLAGAIHLSMHAKQGHWNVKGSDFIALHELFDKVYAEAVAWTDLIAERAVMLGAVAESSLEKVRERSMLPAYGLDVSAGPDHVKAVSASLAAFGGSVRKAIDAADKAGDADTADLFTEVSRGADKMLWFVEAHAQ